MFVRRHVVGLVAVAGWLLLTGSVALAQNPRPKEKPRQPPPGDVTPACEVGCITYSVTVTPDGGTVPRPLNSGPYTATFTVTNTGTPPGSVDTYTFGCSATGGIQCTGVNPASATLSSGFAMGPTAPPAFGLAMRSLGGGSRGGAQSLGAWSRHPASGAYPSSVDVQVTYTVGASGGDLVLTATGTFASDQGWITVVLTGPPTVALRNHNGDNRDRSLCLTAGAGEAAAWGCGDLVVTHGLPGYATMGRERSLSLLYNSALAVPSPVVTAAVTNGGGVSQADSMRVELLVNGISRAAAKYASWGTIPASTRQVAITYDASGDPSGLYPFTLLARNKYASGSYDATVSDTLIVVNRAQSEFGAGWWLVGVEQLVLAQAGNRILWVGGDGSAKVYRNVATNVWQAAAGGFRDTLRYDPGTSTYTRTLRHGIQVKFDAQGRHVQTINRIGQVSTFTWTGNPARLTSIQVPPGGGATTYVLQYDGNSKLDRITDPAGRVLDATVVAGKLTSMTDPDTYSTGFGYDAAGRMTSRTTRRGFATKYAYAKNLRVTQVRIPLNPATADTATTNYTPWDERGLAFGGGVQTAIDTAVSYTKIDGPRAVPDTVVILVDRWGAASRITDPLGSVSSVLRGDVAMPAAITQISEPAGRIIKLSWDTRYNLIQTRDSTLHLTNGQPTAVSTWTYQSPNTKDAPDQAIDPEGVITQFAYNTWGLLSRATAANGHITDYEFVPSDSLAGLLRAVIDRSVPTWDTVSKTEPLADQRTAFAFNRLGNIVSDTSPMAHVRMYTRDTAQRVTNAYDAAGHRRELVYDQLNRVTRSIEHPHPSDTTFTSPLITRQFWNIDVIDSIVDSTRGVARGYRYDAANRRTQEIDDYGHAEAMFYDRAGLIDSARLRYDEGTTGFVTSYVYDAAGRVLKKGWPARSPHAKDSILYTYDAMGRVLTATQSNRKVTRTYYPNDLILTEKQANADGSSEYLHTYAYDRAGRRSWYRMGSGTPADSVWYLYNATSGVLQTVGVKWGSGVLDSVRLRWDELGRRDTLIYPSILNTLRVRFAYDGDGQARLVCGSHDGGPQGLPDVFDFTVYHKTVDVEGLVGQTTHSSTGLTGLGCGQNTTLQGVVTNTYDSRHQITSQTNQSGLTQYQYDASRNIVRITTNTADKIFVMDPGHNRLTKWYLANNPAAGTDYFYDWSGNRTEESPFCPGCNPLFQIGHRGYYYDGLGRMRGSQEQACQEDDGGCSGTYPVDQPNVCKYDPFGRLFDRCEGFGSNIGYLGYDGDNVVRTVHDAMFYSWTFVHGPGMDDPLLAYWRGNIPGNNRYWYYVTDGNGRQLAVGDATGNDMTTDIAYYQNGGKFAGGAKNAESFSIDRNHNREMFKLSFFRNRFYDQATGRWTQEDPVGLAGGLNLYTYVANDPVSNTDPFGLKLCFDENRRQETIDELGKSTGTEIHTDRNGCATGFTRTDKSKKYAFAQWLLKTIIEDPDQLVTASLSGARTGYNAHTHTVTLAVDYGRNYVGFKQCTGPWASLRRIGGVRFLFGLETEDATMANIHELRHAFDYVVGLPITEQRGVEAQDRYARAVGKKLRCDYDN